MKLLTRAGVLLGCSAAVAAAGQSIDADVLRRVPDRAGLALILPSIAALEDGVTEFGKACSVVEIGVDSLAGQVMTSSAGVRRDGTLILAGLPSAPVDWVLICRLEDEAAWRAANVVERSESDSDGEEGMLGVFRTRFLGEDGYGVVRDNLLILANLESALRAAVDAEGRFATELAARRRGLPDAPHAMLVADVGAWRHLLDQRIGLADALAQTAFMMSGGPNARPHIELWRELSRAARSAVWEAKSVAASLRIDGEGARLRTVVAFPSDSSLGAMLATVKAPRDNLLGGLPSGGFALVAGCDLRHPVLASASESVAKWMSGLAARQGAPAPLMAAWRDATAASLLMAIEEDGPVLAVASAATSEPRRLATTVVETLQSASWTRRSDAARQTAIDVLSPPPAQEEGDTAVAERAARRLFGETPELWISVFDPAGPGAAQQTDRGGDDADRERAGVGRVCFALGPAASAGARMTKIVADAGTPLSANTRVRRAVEALPKSPHALLLMDAGPMFALTVRVAQSFGAPVPALPLRSTYAPLIPMGAWLEPEGFRGELLLPSATVREMIDSLRPGSAADRAY